ncbi:MAG: 2-C-methyl-D-erythritol 2,4-cyclodiphosphate synthase [Deltaproteobacteria bacterium]|nr:2-C-methyl-D-erythritol 2,4-cyclodiphosphate synthase [Candidatus Anaeroferrophillacea bacterium]
MMHRRIRGHALIVAAGTGSRCPGTTRKQFAMLADKPLFRWSLERFHGHPRIDSVTLVGPADNDALLAAMAREAAVVDIGITVIPGGTSRPASVAAGIDHLRERLPGEAYILVHDGVRPLADTELISRVLDACAPGRVTVPVIRPPETVKLLAADDAIERTLDRRRIGLAQTPQAAPLELLAAAFGKLADRAGDIVTDEAHLVESAGLGAGFCAVPGDPRNIKLTYPDDFTRAAAYLTADRNDPMPTNTTADPYAAPAGGLPAVGFGYDVHRLVADRRLVLGGVEIPFEKGLAGHSDADVVIHAMVDAILGAIGAGDIGRHFPDTDQRHRDADSRVFLRHAVALADARSFRLTAIDVTIVAQRPKLAPHLPAMEDTLRACLPAPCRLNLKATTTEGLGFTGTGEGIAACAVATGLQPLRG